MTTAARPTFEPARGGQGRGEKDLSAISRQYSSRDLPGHTKLKFREHGQGTTEEARARDFRKELEDREREAKGGSGGTAAATTLQQQQQRGQKRLKLDQVPAASLDADDPLDDEDNSDDGNNNNSDSDDNNSDDDDTEALLAELSKIKRERAVEAAKRDLERKQEEERIRMENILSGNPLLQHYSSGSGSGKPDSSGQLMQQMRVKRRWDDDVVFKNCARTEPEKKANVFINDSLRSEFHKKFMEKYVK